MQPASALAASLPPAGRSGVLPLNEAERALAPVLSGEALVVTRDIEWGTVLLGFEQANKYTLRDAHTGDAVALLAEETATMGSAVARQLLRRRRPMTATVLSLEGEVLFRVRRPMYLVNSSMTVEDVEGNVLGEVWQKFHLWRREYDLMLGKTQFATVRAGLLAWEFSVEDASGRPLASIDRNFQGFGKELFTDAGQYVIRFPEGAPREVTPPPALEGNAAETGGPPALLPMRSLALTERAVCLALAVCVDFDYFSQHSSGPGIMPLGAGMGMPIPVPMGGGAEAEPAADAAPAAPEAPPPDWHSREDLGGDAAFKADEQVPTWSDPPPAEGDGEEDDGGDDEGEGWGGGMGSLVRSVMGVEED